MDSDIQIKVRSDPRFLGSIRSLVRGWVEACDLAQETRDELVLAIDEACSNAIRHAYQGQCDRSIELSLRAEAEFLEVRVSDQGVPCPPKCTERRILESPDSDKLQPGGLGVQLMHKVFDEVEFCPGDDFGNCITMRLKRTK